MPSDNPIPPKPVGIALIPCDNIFLDSTGKQALVGLFNRMSVPTFPVIKGKMCIYASMTDVYPNTRCKIDIVNAETDEPVFEAQGSMDEPGLIPTTICDFVFELNNIIFREPGTYYVRLFGNDQILLQRPFQLMLLQENKGDEDDEQHD